MPHFWTNLNAEASICNVDLVSARKSTFGFVTCASWLIAFPVLGLVQSSTVAEPLIFCIFSIFSSFFLIFFGFCYWFCCSSGLFFRSAGFFFVFNDPFAASEEFQRSADRVTRAFLLLYNLVVPWASRLAVQLVSCFWAVPFWAALSTFANYWLWNFAFLYGKNKIQIRFKMTVPRFWCLKISSERTRPVLLYSQTILKIDK